MHGFCTALVDCHWVQLQFLLPVLRQFRDNLQFEHIPNGTETYASGYPCVH